MTNMQSFMFGELHPRSLIENHSNFNLSNLAIIIKSNFHIAKDVLKKVNVISKCGRLFQSQCESSNKVRILWRLRCLPRRQWWASVS